MKTRNSFVSNSSSTSFVITLEETRQLKYVKAFQVDFLIQQLEAFCEEYKRILKLTDHFSDSLRIATCISWEVEELIKELQRLPQDKWVTEAVDRDWAYENPILCDAQKFKEY